MNLFALVYNTGGLFGLLVHILIVVLVCAIVWWVLTLIPLPPPFRTVATVIFGLIVALILISTLLGLVSCAGQNPPTEKQVQGYATAFHTGVHNGLSDYKEVRRATH